MSKLKLLKKAKDLNEKWDELAKAIYQQKEFLRHCEKYNECGQRYYELYENDKLVAGVVMYTLKLNLFTFSKLKFNVSMSIVGLPASVSYPGVIGSKENVELLVEKVLKKEKGFILGLNLEDKLKVQNYKLNFGKTLPTVVLCKRFKSFEEYKKSLRRSFRRRINKIIDRSKGLEFENVKCNEFDKKTHDLYLEVFNNSKDKLEKLSLDFFKNLPEEFKCTLIKNNSKVIGWFILTENGEDLSFFLGGMDYKYNKKNNLYFNLTVQLLKKAIKKGYKKLDFGQTAETPKVYLGGVIVDKFMFGYHSNAFLNTLIGWFKPILEYKLKLKIPKVFR